MIVELNIPMPADPRKIGGPVIAAAKALRRLGFKHGSGKVEHRVATGEYLLVVRAEYDPHRPDGWTGVNGAVRALCGELGVEPISLWMEERPTVTQFFCSDFSDERDRKTDPNFIHATKEI